MAFSIASSCETVPAPINKSFLLPSQKSEYRVYGLTVPSNPPATKILQSFIIHRKALDDIFCQPFCCPLAESGTNDGFHTITDRNEHVKVIIIHRFRRKIGNSDFSHRLSLLYPSLLISVQYMFIDGRACFTIQFGHLIYCQPDRFILQSHIEPYLTVFRLVDNNLAIVLFYFVCHVLITICTLTIFLQNDNYSSYR